MRNYRPHVLRDYALIADGERGALVGPRGDIAWMCAPRWDADAVFATLIGGDGRYCVTPAGPFVWGGYYEEGTLIWRGRWITPEGTIECHDALAFPGAPDRLIMLRKIIAFDCPARVEVVLDPRAGFGQHGLRSVQQHEGGAWAGRAGGLYLRWSGDVAEAAVHQAGQARTLAMTLTIPAGESRDLILEVSVKALNEKPADAAGIWQATRKAWAQAVPPLNGVLAARDARQSHVVMRGLTSSSGAMAAAATTSLPERPEQGRNYDYRYAWIRDQVYAGRAAAAAGAYPLLDDAVRFVCDRLCADGPRLAPAYTVDGGAVPDQRQLDLPGYPGGFDLVGNWVKTQFQLDVFGESLLLLAAAAERDRLEPGNWRAAEIAADAIAQRWHEEDAGIWEIGNQRWTHSRLICAAGLRAVARTAPRNQAADWSGLADVIVADTAEHAVHPSGRWQRTPDDPGLDAALLMPPLRGAVPPDDPRTTQTLKAYLAELTQDGYAYRFRHDDRPLGDAEGAFLLCGFVVALALHQQGEDLEAARWFERNRAACGSPGLYAEEYDVAERQLRGNIPQAFVHAMMLECAARLASPWPGR